MFAYLYKRYLLLKRERKRQRKNSNFRNGSNPIPHVKYIYTIVFHLNAYSRFIRRFVSWNDNDWINDYIFTAARLIVKLLSYWNKMKIIKERKKFIFHVNVWQFSVLDILIRKRIDTNSQKQLGETKTS